MLKTIGDKKVIYHEGGDQGYNLIDDLKDIAPYRLRGNF